MNDLSLPPTVAEAFPSLFTGLKQAQEIFTSINSFEDVERVFLMGQGLSPNTYRAYLTAVKQFYEFTKGLNPVQVRPGDIEAFFDALTKRTDRNTACLRIKGLKKFFAGITKMIPVFKSPFDNMSKALIRKLNRTKNGNRTRKALTETEIKDLLSWLKTDRSIYGAENYALFYLLMTSGLRASELCQLKLKDLECLDGTWTARFIGKGGKQAEQELYTPALESCFLYFRKQFKRNHQADDSLFYTVPRFHGDQVKPLSYRALYHRITQIGRESVKQGIIKRELSFTPHLMRRTYATILYKSGMGLKAIQEKTRHANIEVLVRHYIHDDEKASPYFQRLFQRVAG